MLLSTRLHAPRTAHPTAEVPEHLAAEGYEGLRYTLVDCPGHASLIRTVIGARGQA